MESNHTHFNQDLPNKRMTVTRSFDADRDDVWRAWSERELLDQWWAPRPWRAETKSMDFREGGHWLYAMVSPENERHWARIDYKTINRPQGFFCEDYFCNDEGVRNVEFPTMFWDVAFHSGQGKTTAVIDIAFNEAAHMTAIMEMGFKEGFTSALNNLEEYLRDGFKSSI